MIWLLLVVYQLKHFLADYPLQNGYMLGKFKKYPDFVFPLLAHAGVHGLFTFLIALCFKSWPVALVFGLADMAVHFAVDRVKASPNLGGRFKALTKKDFEEHFARVAELKRLIMGADTGEGLVLTDHLEKIEKEWANRLESNKYFWWSLGADQTVHHITHYAIIWALLF